ncbi:egg cell-secreted protein 1.2-like [Papaver somniferum]|uniref:egg cell-secreted protein 1.2-like n=1 Tax=Papaver somniferum TaxID=3469 RepID=UPI000E6FA586|nr:egg cell-secreted protein 1.2-like [Papaver somniferum]
MGTAESQPLAPTQLDTVQIPGLFPPLLPGPYNPEIGKCWSTLVDIQGCQAEILNFLFTFQLRLGPACCKAIIDLSETCLPAVFSSDWGWGRGILFNPVYPNVVKGYCASITGGKTSPLARSTKLHLN